MLYLTINDPLPVLPGNEQDLGHQNIVNTCLFYEVCKVHDILKANLPMQRSDNTVVQNWSFRWQLCETPVFGRSQYNSGNVGRMIYFRKNLSDRQCW